MAQRVSLKLLILFGIVCTTFVWAERTGFAAPIENKSSTFSTQMANRNDDNGGTNSEFAEQIRAQRAAIEAREARDVASTQTKSGTKQNNCDSDLRKCITNQCGANYKKCETDSDTTFSDKLNTCRKNTNCTAHEFTLFTNEIKEDKKQEIALASYNSVIDCGNSYNNCIIQQCGPKFNKCLSKSNGDKAIAACKQIAQNCTEADSGLTGRIGNVFGIVRETAEKQIKTDEAKLQKLRDSMRNSCRTLGAMFDDRTLDCIFNVSFYAGDDTKTPKASKKLYAGSTFDCTPDWFGIDITTFKENAYRLTRSQTAASSAMLGSGIGTAVGAITSGAISRAIETKKAKDALSDECEKNGQILDDGKCRDMTEKECKKSKGKTWKNGKCVDGTTQNNTTTNNQSNDQTPDNDTGNDTNTNNNDNNTGNDNADNNTDNNTNTDAGQESSESTKTAENNGGSNSQAQYIQKITPTSDAEPIPAPAPLSNDDNDIQNTIDAEHQNQVNACTDSGGTWNDKKKSPCSCSKSKGLIDDIKGFTCTCSLLGYTFDKATQKCKKEDNSIHRQKCEETGGIFYDYPNGGGCVCEPKYLLERVDKDGYRMCKCRYDEGTTYYDAKAKRCFYTEEAIKKCDTTLVGENKKATGDKAKGCICPPPYEEWQEDGPTLNCLKPLQ